VEETPRWHRHGLSLLHGQRVEIAGLTVAGDH
jgi:hypothetical protein